MTSRLKVALTATAVSLACFFTPGANAAPDAPSAAALPPSDLDAMAVVVVVKDVHGLTEKAAEFARNVSPQITGDQLRAMGGAALGDPGLTGMKPGSGMALLVPAKGGMMVFLEVSPDKIESYEKTLAGPAYKTARADGMLLMTDNPALLETSKKLAADVKANLLDGPGGANIRVDVHPADLIAKNQAAIDAGLEQMKQSMTKANPTDAKPGAPDPALISSMLLLEAKAALAMAKNVKKATITVSPSAEGLDVECRKWDMNPTAAATLPPAEQFRKLLPMKGALRAAGGMDMGPLYLKLAAALPEAASGLDLEPAQVAALKEMLQAWGDAMGPGLAMDYMDTTTSPTSHAYVLGVKDEAKALSAFEQTASLWSASGFEKMMGSGMSMKFDFKKNVRQLGELSVHQLIMRFDGFPADQQEMMKTMMGSGVFDIVFLNKMMLYASGSGRIEKLVAAVQAGASPESKPLASEALGKNGILYVDYALGQLVGMMANGMPGMPAEATSAMATIGEGTKDAPPFMFAVFQEPDGLRTHFRVPAGLIKAGAEAAQKIQTQQPSQSPSESGRPSNAPKMPQGALSPPTR